ncbi:MAG: type III secretion system chaperone [Methylocystis sp.]|uniref:type III secretion system chaperone n=1 Tax=Methylocystis sp. TaxID=1911079 RepID=UPI003DA48DCF
MIDVLDAILTDLAGSIGARHIGRTGNESWLILFETQGEPIEIEYAAERALLVFSAALTAPRPEAREILYHLALQYNYLWTETGGARLSLDGPDGALVLSVEMASALVAAAKIEASLRDMRTAATKWKNLIETIAPTPREETKEAMTDWRRV